MLLCFKWWSWRKNSKKSLNWRTHLYLVLFKREVTWGSFLNWTRCFIVMDKSCWITTHQAVAVFCINEKKENLLPERPRFSSCWHGSISWCQDQWDFRQWDQGPVCQRSGPASDIAPNTSQLLVTAPSPSVCKCEYKVSGVVICNISRLVPSMSVPKDLKDVSYQCNTISNFSSWDR